MDSKSLGWYLYGSSVRGEVEEIRRLLEQGYPVNCRGQLGWTPLMVACANNRADVVRVLLKYEPDVNLQDDDGDTALHKACQHWCVQLLTATGQCDLGIKNKHGRIPLEEAVYRGRLDVVTYLITECSIDIKDLETLKCILKLKVGSKVYCDKYEENNAILMMACKHGWSKVVDFMLTECHCDPNVKDDDGQTPLALTQDKKTIRLLLQHGAIAQDAYALHKTALGKVFSKDPLKSPVKIFVIGHGSEGKSTLIEAMEHEPSIFAPLMNIFVKPKEVKGVDQRTAGIIPRTFKSRFYGDVQFYDFAGQEAYYSSHAPVIKSAVDTSSPIFLFVVGLHRGDTTITQAVSYWLEIIADQCGNMEGKAPLIVVASHADLVTDQAEVDQKKQIISQAVKRFPIFNMVEIIPLDCRFSNSNGMKTLRRSVGTSCDSVRAKLAVSLSSHMLLIYLLNSYPNEVAITLEELKQKIEQDITSRELSKKHKQTLTFIPTTIPRLVEICIQLSDKGHILLLQDTLSSEKSFVIIDKTKLLSKINGTMFAPEDFKQHCKIATSTGVVPQSKLAAHFPEFRTKLLIGFLSHLELAVPIEDKEVLGNIDQHLSELAPSECYLFCPALIRLEAVKQVYKFEADLAYHFGWVMLCSDDDRFLNPRFLQVLLLRLAVSLNLAPIPNTSIPALQYQCSVWKTGVCWSTADGFKVLVEVVNKKKVIVLIQAQEPSSELFKLRSTVINKVVEAAKEFCPSVVTDEVILSPSDVTYPLVDSESTPVFSLKSIAESILGKKISIVSTSGIETLPVSSLAEVYTDLDESILQPLFRENNLACNTKVSDRFLSALSSSWSENPQLMDIIRSAITKETKPTLDSCDNLESALKLWRDTTNASYKNLRQLLDPLSVFAGRSPLELAGVSPKPFSEESLPYSQPTVPQSTSSGRALGGGLTIEDLKRRTGVINTQLDTEIIEHDLYNLAGCFDNLENYVDKLQLTAIQQADLQELADRRNIQTAMAKALKLWYQPNPFAATFRALLMILLDLRRGDVAVSVCKYITDKVHNS